MKTNRLLILILLFLAPLFAVNAQVMDLEKTYTISGKAKRGSLAKVEFDEASMHYVLTYVTKANEKMARFQIYTFDKDFNFVKEEIDEIEFEKAKTKYKWFSFKGELYTVEGNFVEPNLLGTLILKQKRIHYKYDWLLLGYYKDIEILKKVKPKTEDGRTFFYYKHAEDDVTGDVYVLCGIKSKIKKDEDPWKAYKEYVVLKFNSQLELVKESSITFEYPQTIAFSRSIEKFNPEDPENPGVSGMAFVFAPMGGTGMSKVADPENTNYTYVRIDENAQVTDRIPFKSYASYWQIDEMVREINSDDMFLFGPSAAGKDKYYNASLGQTKFKAVQLMKISNHKVEYFTETNLEEFAAKLKLPPTQKKSPDYEGKKFEIANYHVAANGDFLIVGQNFNTSKEGKKFNDVLAFHFDAKGVLKSQYGIDTKESNQYSKAAGTPQFFIEKGNDMFWFLQEIKGFTATRNKVLSYPRGGKINLANGTVSDFTIFGGKDDYYLDPKFPYLQTTKDNTIVFFGSNKSGKEIWFMRVLLK